MFISFHILSNSLFNDHPVTGYCPRYSRVSFNEAINKYNNRQGLETTEEISVRDGFIRECTLGRKQRQY
jgi:hypothetical protein